MGGESHRDDRIDFDSSHKVDADFIDPCRAAFKGVCGLGVGSEFRAILQAANDNGGQYESDLSKIERYLKGRILEAKALLDLENMELKAESVMKILQICARYYKTLE
jgi:hypothetical protein